MHKCAQKRTHGHFSIGQAENGPVRGPRQLGSVNRRSLNNTSDERVKLKVACYPGRVYYGKIDPGKIDTVNLDFSQLYESQDIQSAENAAVDYTKRLLEKRFEAFGESRSQFAG